MDVTINLGGVSSLPAHAHGQDGCMAPGWRGLYLGHQGERNSRTVRIDCTELLKALPGAELALVCRRPGESTLYMPNVTTEGRELLWLVSPDDTQLPGEGTAEVQAVLGDAVRKSMIYRTWVDRSQDGQVEPVTPAPPEWVQEVLEHRGLELDPTMTDPNKAAPAGVVGPVIMTLATGNYDKMRLAYRSNRLYAEGMGGAQVKYADLFASVVLHRYYTVRIDATGDILVIAAATSAYVAYRGLAVVDGVVTMRELRVTSGNVITLTDTPLSA